MKLQINSVLSLYNFSVSYEKLRDSSHFLTLDTKILDTQPS